MYDLFETVRTVVASLLFALITTTAFVGGNVLLSVLVSL
jgi:hypothetical protein